MQAIVTLPLSKCELELSVHCFGYIALGLNHSFQYVERNGEEECIKTKSVSTILPSAPALVIQQ